MENIIIVGNVNLDIVAGPIHNWPEWGTEINVNNGEIRIGGSAGNTAIALSELNLSSSIISIVGNDLFGAIFKNKFSELGIDIENLEICKGKTAFSIGITHKEDTERVFFTNEGVMNTIDLDFLTEKLEKIRNSHILFTGVNLLPGLKNPKFKNLLKRLNSKNTIYLDPGWPVEGWDFFGPHLLDILENVHYFLPNEMEFLSLMKTSKLERAIDEYNDRFNNKAIIKMGPRGSLLLEDGIKTFNKTTSSNCVVDTIGAGDSFNAGILYSSTRSKNIDFKIANELSRKWIEGKFRDIILL